MAFHFLLPLLALFAFVHDCSGQLLLRFLNTERAVSTCDTIDLQWAGGLAPYQVTIVDLTPQVPAGARTARRKFGDVLVTFPVTNTQTQPWTVDSLDPTVTQVRVQVVDSLRLTAFKVLAVNRIAGRVCSPNPSSSSSLPSSSSAASSSASSTASSASSQPPPSSTSSSTVPNLPTEPSVPQQTTTESTATSRPSAAGRVGAAKTTVLPTTAIVGIVVGGIVALAVLILGIFCFRKQTKAKSDPLDSWDGGYDPESVFKATAQFGGPPSTSTGRYPAPESAVPLWNPVPESTVPVWNPTRTQSRSDSPPVGMMSQAPLRHNQPVMYGGGHSPEVSLTYQPPSQSMAQYAQGPPPPQKPYPAGQNVVRSGGGNYGAY